MKTLSYKGFLPKLKGNAKVIFDNQTYYIHGLYNQVDLIIKGKLEKRLFNKPTLIEYRNNEKPKRETNKIKELIKRIEDLFYVDYITSFNLSKYLIKQIKLSIRKNNVTHMRFYTFNNDVKLNLFDIRSFIGETQFTRQNSLKVFSLPSVQFIDEIFSRTLNSETFLKLPDEDFGVNITKSHVVIFDDTKNQCSFLISHQDLQEPITHFVNPKINKSVSFLYTKNLAVRNTQKNI
jgi:hypothetical protein